MRNVIWGPPSFLGGPPRESPIQSAWAVGAHKWELKGPCREILMESGDCLVQFCFFSLKDSWSVLPPRCGLVAQSHLQPLLSGVLSRQPGSLWKV